MHGFGRAKSLSAWLNDAARAQIEREELGDVLASILCGHAHTTDVIDASVVVAARRHDAVVLSSDREDLERLDPTVAVIDC